MSVCKHCGREIERRWSDTLERDPAAPSLPGRRTMTESDTYTIDVRRNPDAGWDWRAERNGKAWRGPWGAWSRGNTLTKRSAIRDARQAVKADRSRRKRTAAQWTSIAP